MIKKTVLIIFASLALAACSYSATTSKTGSTQTPSSGQTQGASDLTIKSYAFLPNSLNVTAGKIVTITNDDSVPHTVTSDDGKSFDTGTINPGQTGSFTAPTAGTYAYHCNFHKSMAATLVVK